MDVMLTSVELVPLHVDNLLVPKDSSRFASFRQLPRYPIDTDPF